MLMRKAGGILISARQSISIFGLWDQPRQVLEWQEWAHKLGQQEVQKQALETGLTRVRSTGTTDGAGVAFGGKLVTVLTSFTRRGTSPSYQYILSICVDALLAYHLLH